MSDSRSQLSIDTLAIRAGLLRSELGEHSEAIYPTVSFVYKNAAEAAARFGGERDGYMYSRFTNPSVRMFEERLAALEGGEDCMGFSSGMAAIMALVMCSTQAGDHVVVSGSVFGSTLTLIQQVMGKFGVQASVVYGSDLNRWQDAMRPNTKLVFVESPSNPLTEVFDLRGIGRIAKAQGALFAVDNCFCTPVLQQPLALGADIVVHSATKHLDGQGRVLGGALVGPKKFLRETVYPYLRTTGATMSAFNAWIFNKGLETLPIRMRAHCEVATRVATWLESKAAVERVYYPGLKSHPQFTLAESQQSGGGAVLSFAVKGGRAEAWKVIDACQMVSISANLGDVKSIVTHPYTTTHARVSPAMKADAGIGENLIRLSVGLEDPNDICRDLARGLDSVSA